MTHIIGTALGVGGATFAEIFFLKAIRDGQIDPLENSFLKVTYRVLRIGLLILVISGFGYLLLLRLLGREALLYQPTIWAKLTIIIILVLSVIGWQAKKVPLWLGSAISLTSWYTALVLGVWRNLQASYLEIILWYLLAVIIVAGILHFIRRLLGITV